MLETSNFSNALFGSFLYVIPQGAPVCTAFPDKNHGYWPRAPFTPVVKWKGSRVIYNLLINFQPFNEPFYSAFFFLTFMFPPMQNFLQDFLFPCITTVFSNYFLNPEPLDCIFPFRWDKKPERGWKGRNSIPSAGIRFWQTSFPLEE